MTSPRPAKVSSSKQRDIISLSPARVLSPSRNSAIKKAVLSPLKGKNWANSRFQKINYSDHDFSSMNLEGSEFLDVNLSGANFTMANLRSTYFRNTIFVK